VQALEERVLELQADLSSKQVAKMTESDCCEAQLDCNMQTQQEQT